MDASKVCYPEIVHSGPKHEFIVFLRPKVRMDASQLRYLEIVHSGPKHNYCLFYVPKVSEMLRNTPKHHFGWNVVEWMLRNFVVLQ
jgi:hypothetical protein